MARDSTPGARRSRPKARRQCSLPRAARKNAARLSYGACRERPSEVKLQYQLGKRKYQDDRQVEPKYHDFRAKPGPYTPGLREEAFPYSIGGSSCPAFEVSIGSLDEPSLTVQAMFRPSEISIDQSAPWSPHHNSNGVWLEFSGAVSRGASIELFLDASEAQNGSVAREAQNLARLADVRRPGSTIDEFRRPHHCILVFGNVFQREHSFPCVIESVTTKYTRFSPFGEPTRATVNLKLKQAKWVREPPKRNDGPADPEAPRSAPQIDWSCE